MDFWPINNGIELGIEGKRILVDRETLGRHTLIIGKTGTGKSYLLSKLIEKMTGLKRLIIFDLHGELWKVRDQNADVIALREYEDQRPGYLKFNMMGVLPYKSEFEKTMNQDLTIQGLKDIFSREESYSHGTWGPRIELVFTILPRLLMKYKHNPTIEDLLKLLLDPYERRDFLSTLDNEDKIKYYSIFNSQGYDFISSSVNKLMPLLSNRISRYAFASPRDSIDFSKLKNDLYIVLSPEFSSSLIAKQFSIMLLYKIWNYMLMKKTENVAIIIDEFQILSPSIAEIFLTEGRKFGMNLIAATQTTSTLNVKLNNIIRTNVSNIIAFKGSEPDYSYLVGEKITLNSEHEFQWSNTYQSLYFKGKLKYSARKPIEFRLSRDYYSFEEDKEIGIEDWKDPYLAHILASENLIRLEGNRIVPTQDYLRIIGSRKTKGNESIYHRYLITRAYLYLKSLGLRVYENVVLDGGTPDLVIIQEDREIPVECEYSDLKNPSRILEKIKKYGEIIFVTFKGYESRLPQGSRMILVPPIGENEEIETVNLKLN